MGGQGEASTGVSWAVRADELQGYRGIFEELDARGVGRLEFHEVRAVFDRSALSQEDLSHIWRLSDADEDGFLTLGEFSCALHLLQRRRQGATLPLHRPPELSQLLEA